MQGLAIGGHGSVSIEERPVGRLAATLPILSSTLSYVVAGHRPNPQGPELSGDRLDLVLDVEVRYPPLKGVGL